VLGDPPIDWVQVRTPADALPFGDRDGFLARQVEQAVLARSERALLITGLYHVLRLGPAALRSSGTAAERIEAAHPGTVSSLMVYVGFPGDLRAARQRLLSSGSPRLVRTCGTWLGELPAGAVFRGPPQAPLEMGTSLGARPLREVIDGVLVLGDPATFTLSVTGPAIYRDPVLVAELRRLKRLFRVENDPRLGMTALLAPQQVQYYRRP
jgi:hypothetical protein